MSILRGSRMPVDDTGDVLRREHNKVLEAQYGSPGPINQTRPNQDPQNQTAASLQSFNTTGRLVIGQITDCTSFAHVYRVQFEKAKQPMVATFLPRSCCASTGPKDLTTLQVGTPVVCMIHDQLPWAAIIGALPLPGTSAKKAAHGIIAGSTRARVDNAHRKPFLMPTTNNTNGGIPDLLSGRPYDALCGGEVGWISEFGMKLFQDQWMTLLGLDEMCGISFFYHDSLARFAAYNMQMWTAVRECESYNDQDECQDWTGYAGFPWEQMGSLERTDPTVIKTPKEWQVDEPWYGKIEPADDWAMPWHREREFHGYLGQGGMRIVQAPPIEEGDHVCYAGGNGLVGAMHPGLMADFTTQDGRRCIVAAKGISIVKRCAIATPTRIRRPEQPVTGDTEATYKASSMQGEGPDHVITGDIETSGPNSQFNRIMGVFDMHAYFFNYVGIHPFFYHDKDYKVWEEQDVTWTDGKSEESPPFTELAGSMYLTPDQFKKTLQIDHRYGEQDFYTLTCGLELLDDGGVVLYGGMGEELRLAGGSIFTTAPGDVWLKSGRNVNVWAGWDFCARAKNSWDITATDHDGRLKAERNIQVLAGNSGVGGVLIESRASGPIYEFDETGELVVSSGVILRAPKSEVVNWAMNIYLRTGGGNVSDGVIMLDAAKGDRDIITQQRSQFNYVADATYIHFGAGIGEVDKTTSFGQSTTVICSQTCIDGMMILAGNLVMEGSILVAGGHIITEEAKTFPYVAPLVDEALVKTYKAVELCRELAEDTLPKSGVTYWSLVVDPLFYEDGSAGNDDVITKGEFSLRSLADYRTEDFKIYEDRWQQMGRLAGTASQQWRERPVTSQGGDTYPYPGKENYTGNRLYRQPLTLFDLPSGRSKNRGSQPELATPYAEPKFGEPTAVELSNYLVIR